jgi:D-inositol-3-phosphate glycosyltransferase
MNVYLKVLARHLARAGLTVEMFTRATADHPPGVTQFVDHATVHHIEAGDLDGVTKEELPALVDVFAENLLRDHPVPYELVHAHYWLSGLAGATVAKAWDVPLVATMHTAALVKNASLSVGEQPEPELRIAGEQKLIKQAHHVIANTQDEAHQLITHYGADRGRLTVITPGVDLEVFRPGDSIAQRRELGIGLTDDVVMFAGRIQPFKAPDVLIQAIGSLLRQHPERRSKLLVPIVGGPSGSGFDRPTWLIELVRELDLEDVVRFVPPQPHNQLAKWYGAADVVVVPSYHESFGLVAAEAQACGTPVIATNVGGLPLVVADGLSGLLVTGHYPDDWAKAIEVILSSEKAFNEGAAEQAKKFSWESSAQQLLMTYQLVVDRYRADRLTGP